MIDYDIIICVGWNDITIVKKTVKYLRRNLQGKNIYLIVNSFYFRYFASSFLKKYNVELIDEDLLLPGVSYIQNRSFIDENRPGFSSGWYFQQFLKMGFSQSKYARDYYLIWDADTLPLSKIEFEKKGRLLFTQKKEYHEEYDITMEKLLGLKKVKSYSFIAEHMLIKTDIMREIISKISIDSLRPWPFTLLMKVRPEAKSGFSEFETYGTYTSVFYPDLYESRTLNTWRNAGYVFGRNISEKDIEALSVDLDLISLENWNGRLLPQKIFSRLSELYVKYLRYLYLRKNKLSVKDKLKYMMGGGTSPLTI